MSVWKSVFLRISDEVYSGVLFRQGSGLLSTRLGCGTVVRVISYNQQPRVCWVLQVNKVSNYWVVLQISFCEHLAGLVCKLS